MSTATIVPQPAPSLYHTNYPAFADALRAVAPELFTTAEDYRARAAEHGITFNGDEALGRAVHVLLSLVGPADDEIEPDEADDPINQVPDYNDDELLQCGIQH
jgi:hypothetical protein